MKFKNTHVYMHTDLKTYKHKIVLIFIWKWGINVLDKSCLFNIKDWGCRMLNCKWTSLSVGGMIVDELRNAVHIRGNCVWTPTTLTIIFETHCSEGCWTIWCWLHFIVYFLQLNRICLKSSDVFKVNLIYYHWPFFYF